VAGSSSSVPFLPPSLALLSNGDYTLRLRLGLRHIFSSVKIIAGGVILLLRMDFVLTNSGFQTRNNVASPAERKKRRIFAER